MALRVHDGAGWRDQPVRQSYPQLGARGDLRKLATEVAMVCTEGQRLCEEVGEVSFIYVYK